MTDPCIRGCVDRATGDPLEATFGQLCGLCAARVADHVDGAAGAARGLAEFLTPSLKAASLGERVQASADPRLPFSISHREALDDLHDVLATNVDEAVRIMGVVGPPGSRDRLAADRAPSGIPARATPAGAEQRVRVLAEWLAGHLESVAYLVIAGSVHDEIVDVVRRARGLAGLIDPLARPARRVCTVCLTRAVRVEWLDAVTTRVRCQQCGAQTDEFDASALLGVAS